MSATPIHPMSGTPIHAMSGTPIHAAANESAPRIRALLLIDPLLALAAFGLVACSLITLRGATRNTMPGQPLYYVERQGIYAALGLVVALLLTRIDYSRLREYKFGMYGLLIVLNIVVFAMPLVRGAHRWIPLPFFQVQSSEFGKILLVASLGAFAIDRSRRLHERRTTARIMLLALVPALIVIPQPDLGTGLVYVTVAFTILFVAGTSWKQLTALVAMFAASIAIVLAGAPALGVHVLKPYQVQRLTGFLNPSHDPRNQTYNITQSLIAIGSGQKTGLGVANATQTSQHFLPESQTDFIFAVVGETYGFVGAALVLSLYALLIWRSLRILMMAKNLYGTMISGGILAMLMFQVFVNVGMTIGIMPITGVPLPLMSYGGSSVLVTFIALGLLQSIHIQARLAAAGKARALLS
jgi:rod shape determining protein RodA